MREEFADKIYLYSDLKLYEKVEQLTKELLDLDKIKTQNLAIVSENDELKIENKSLKQNLSNIHNTAKEQSVTISNLTQEITMKATQIKQLTEQNNQQKEIMDATKDVVLLVKENQILKIENSDLDKKLQEQIHKYKQKDQAIIAKQNEIQNLENIIYENQYTINNQSEIIHHQQNQLDELFENIQNISEQNSKIRNENKELKSQISLLDSFKNKAIDLFKIIVKQFSPTLKLISQYLPEIKDEIEPKSSSLVTIDM
ncbi:hypothetical protein [Campylobacter sp. RM16187]|uniref:hypothetical protein n=1 Tax=Campylobacter sp. RM16187 TaxID=1660063 RepID=UPI0021B57135|nr:hypothetical protein [Campylobacter sp. RM16187]QKG30022.1 hypothetical protein CDOMF_1793 [Campylobacter sp. RM16187]